MFVPCSPAPAAMNSSERKQSPGRAAVHNPHNRFSKQVYERVHEEGIDLPDEESEGQATQYLDVFPKTIVNKVHSPDVGMDYSLNPYQGCEHGCVYCYARVSHQYWGYSAGVEFEQKVLVKRNAAQLLREHINAPSWQAAPIALSGNTDSYQPVERKLGLTRQLLEVFLEHRHPVGIITKNALVLRDLDLLKELASMQLVKVAISITTLDEDLRRAMEPRTSTIGRRFEAVEQLSQNGIPVMVMMAPIIPGLNSHEILPLVKEAANRGALKVGYTMVRLNGEIGEVFERWVRTSFPERAQKVLHQIADAHGGKLSDSRYGTRMKGEGRYAEMVKQTFLLARNRYLQGREMPPYALHHFAKAGQMRLF